MEKISTPKIEKAQNDLNWWIFWIAPKDVLRENNTDLTKAWINRENEDSKVIKYTCLIAAFAQAAFFYLDSLRAGFDPTFSTMHRAICGLSCFVCYLVIQTNLFKSFEFRFVLHKALFLACGLILSGFQFVLMFRNPEVPRIYPAAILVIVISASGIGPMNTTLVSALHTSLLIFMGVITMITGKWTNQVSDISYQMIALILSFVVASKYTLQAKLFIASWKENNRVNNLFHDTKEWGNRAFNELTKLVYPHVVNMIHNGSKIEDTMPVGQKNAYCVTFDVIGSTKIVHERFHQQLEIFLGRCFDFMNDGYKEETLENSAYRVKDLGDGFMCSVGFPFAVPHGRQGSVVAIELAERFVEEFHTMMSALEYGSPITCAVGIAYGELEGYFPALGTKQYDLRGKGLVLSTRYESLRKSIPGLIPEGHSAIVLSEPVWSNLPAQFRGKFTEIVFEKAGVVVRDDPGAKKAYVRVVTTKNNVHLINKCVA